MGHLFSKNKHICHIHSLTMRMLTYLLNSALSGVQKRDQRRLSQLTALASNSALLSPSLPICCLPSNAEKEYTLLGHLQENGKLECKPTQTVRGRGL